jgi:peptidyl-prolyl cis-trans isomerase C
MRIATLALALIALPLAASTPVSLEAPLIVDGDIRVDAGDVEGFVLRFPAERRAEARGSGERIATYADSIFLARTFAARARQAGLDKDPIVQRRLVQAQDALLADLYLQNAEKGATVPNLEARARELYLAEPARFTSPEQVHVQHILVGPQWRTREMAQERAQKIHEDLKSGKEDFLSLAARYSDDPDKKRNGGDLGYNSPTSFVGPVRQAIDAMTKKGEISAPIESSQGFHIVRFVDRKKPELAKFEDVKRAIIATERERLVKKIREDSMASVRDSKTVVVHRDNLQALVVPLDEVLKRAAAVEAASATASAPK